MKSENAIEICDVKKSFKVYKDRGNMLKEMVIFAERRKFEIHEVLKGISFTVRKGEAVGLIGQNGCGKSTTLKLLTKIIYPDSGSIEMKGRVSSLIELGAGFHPDMSGRENIYINASIFGLNRNEIAKRIDDIIAFSELEEYIDNPVRTYSSGMYMRLAFSVAINVDADILLIDEILAVGDANFQAKCFNKLREIKASGTTIVIVSHSLGQIEQICERSIWIHNGKIWEQGSPREVHPVYLDYMGQKRLEIAKHEEEKQTDLSDDLEAISTKAAFEKNKKRWGNGMARIQNIEILNEEGLESTVFETGKNITIKLQYCVKQRVEEAVIGIGFYRTDGVYIYGVNTRLDKINEFCLEKDGVAKIILKNVNLMPGQYTIDFALESGLGIPVDYYREAKKIEFFTTKEDVGLVRIEHEWEIVSMI